MQRSLHNEVEIYNISATKSLPDWLSDRRRRRLMKRDRRLARQVSLIHDFEMPNLSTNVAATPDQKCLFAMGTYKPRIKCFEVENMAEKFTRGVDALPHKIEFVGADFSKFWLLEDDRWLEFHAREGHLFKTRIPVPGRDLAFFGPTNQLFVTGAGPDLYRFDQSSGRFLPPLASPSEADLTACTASLVNGLLFCGSVKGTVDAWDPRQRRCCSSVAAGCVGEEVSCLRLRDGLNLGVGLSKGKVLLFDLRMRSPRLEKEHHYGLPIRDLVFHRFEESRVISMDRKCVKIWDDVDGAPTWAAFEPGMHLNGLHVWPNSGLLHLANEEPQLLSYFIPQLGPAPSWCSLLYLLLEECEAEEQTMFDGHKFVAREELERWGLTSLIGSDHLRAYMHGFFMDSRLYSRLRALVGPMSREEIADAQVEEWMKKRREQTAISEVTEKEEPIAAQDERFRALMTDPEFAVDPSSEEANKTQRLKRIKERKEQKRLRAREKAKKSNKILEKG